MKNPRAVIFYSALFSPFRPSAALCGPLAPLLVDGGLAGRFLKVNDPKELDHTGLEVGGDGGGALVSSAS